MKVFKTFIFYPTVILGLALLASGNKLFAHHNGWWTFALLLFAFGVIDIPLVFSPYYEEMRKRKQARAREASTKKDLSRA